jgi:hypothetical protein
MQLTHERLKLIEVVNGAPTKPILTAGGPHIKR